MSQRPAHAKHTAPPARKAPPIRVQKAAGGAAPKSAAPDIKLLLIRLVLASVLFAVSLIVKMPSFVKVILLILAAAAAGYDIVMSAFDSIMSGDYFATSVVVTVVAFISYIIGFAAEGAALVILHQIGGILIVYVGERTKKTAAELLQRRDEEAADNIREQIKAGSTGTLSIESVMRESSSLVLKAAMIFAVVYAIVLPLATSYSFIVSIHRAITIILISTPVSIVAAMPFTGMIGLSYSAHQGVIYNSVASMEAAASANVAVFDKAGIFTDGSPRVLSIESDVLDKENFINFASHAAYYSEQPVARAIAALNEQEYKLDIISDFEEVPGSGIDVNISGLHVTLGTREFFSSRGVYVPQADNEAGKPYYMTIADRYIGKVTVSDEINLDAAELASGVKETGIRRCVLLTEESDKAGQRFAEEFDFDEAFCQCTPDTKLRYISDLSESADNRIVYVYSNGIETHSAAAVDMRVSQRAKYADAVVIPESVANIPFSFQVCNRMREVAIENSVFAFVVKAILIFLSIVGYCNVWFAIFIDIAATLATILNSVRVTNESLISSFKSRTGN